MEQIEAALSCDPSSIIIDLPDLDEYAGAVRAVRSGGVQVLCATPRIDKPGESGVFEMLARAEPDGVLARNLAGLGWARRLGLPAVADFSLNAVNRLTVEWLHDQGAQRVTAAYDLDRRRLFDLATAVPPEWLEVVVYRHAPMFHTEYCLFCGTLGHAANRRECGRPCRRHRLQLRDRMGVEHLLQTDSQCRGTLYHAETQDFSEWLTDLLASGMRHFRVELIAENSATEVQRVMRSFGGLSAMR